MCVWSGSERNDALGASDAHRLAGSWLRLSFVPAYTNVGSVIVHDVLVRCAPLQVGYLLRGVGVLIVRQQALAVVLGEGPRVHLPSRRRTRPCRGA